MVEHWLICLRVLCNGKNKLAVVFFDIQLLAGVALEGRQHTVER